MDISNKLIETMQIIAESSAKKVDAALVVEAEICAVADAGKGVYKAKYLGNILTVSASEPSVVYNVGDLVNVVIPNGDFSKTKTILGLVDPATAPYISSEPTSYRKVSENLIEPLYNEEIEISTWKNPNARVEWNYEGDAREPAKDFFRPKFSNYCKKYDTFLFEVDIRTAIEANQQQKGNYGITLSIPVLIQNPELADETIEAYWEITLDKDNILGAFYKLESWAGQFVRVKFPKTMTYDASSDRGIEVTAFKEDFSVRAEETNDIFFRHLGFYAMKELTEAEMTGYHLELFCDDGPYFLDTSKETKTIQMDLLLNGKSTLYNNYECYWFVEDASVKTSSKDYTTFGGMGWKCLNSRVRAGWASNGEEIFDYEKNRYSYAVKRDEIVGSNLKYKCVLIIDEKIVSQTIVLYNTLNKNIVVDFDTNTAAPAYGLQSGFIDLTVKTTMQSSGVGFPQLEYEFLRYDKDGNYLDDFLPIGQQTIPTRKTDTKEIVANNVSDSVVTYEAGFKIHSTEIDELNTINCTVYITGTKGERIILGSDSVMITTRTNFAYTAVLQNADVAFKYDADGDSPLLADYDGPISSRLSTINPIVLKIFNSEGEEIPEEQLIKAVKHTWYIPVDSMIQLDTAYYSSFTTEGNYYVLKYDSKSNTAPGPELHYTIRPLFDVGRRDNTILYQGEYDGNIITASATIKFLKDGESGTNGSRYTAIITSEGYGYDETDWEQRVVDKVYRLDGDTQTTKIVNYKRVKKKLRGVHYIIGGQDYWKLVVPKTSENNKGCKLQDYANLKIKVYKDGTFYNTKDSDSVEWSMFDQESINTVFKFKNSKVTEITDKEGSTTEQEKKQVAPLVGQIRIALSSEGKQRSWDENDKVINIIQAKISIYNENEESAGSSTIGSADRTDDGDTTKDLIDYTIANTSTVHTNEVIYAYYPIECIDLGDISSADLSEDEIARFVPSIDGGFSQVIYSSAGINPKFNNTDSFTVANGLGISSEDEKKYYTYIWSHINDNLIDPTDGEQEADPSSVKYNVKNRYTENLDSQNAVVAKLSLDTSELGRVRESYETELAAATDSETDSVNANQYHSLKTLTGNFLDNAKKLSYNSIVSRDEINDITNDLNTRGVILNLLNQLLEVLQREDTIEYESYISVDGKIALNRSDLITKLTNTINEVGLNKGTDGILINAEPLSIMTQPTTADDRSRLLRVVTDYNAAITGLRDILQGANTYSSSFVTTYYNAWMLILNQYDCIEAGNDKINVVKDSAFYYLLNSIYVILNTVLPTVFSYDNFINDVVRRIDKLIAPYETESYQSYLDERATDTADQVIALKEKVDDVKLVQKVFLDAKKTVTIVKPILFLLNRYELTHLTDWDGNKLYIDETNGQYLFAPQLGAGIKEDNTFTGMTMGVRDFHKEENNTEIHEKYIGLFGYNKGIQSMFLNAKDGSAIFGEPQSSQITLDPNGITDGDNEKKALLFSGSFYNEYSNDGKPSSYKKSNERSVRNLSNWTGERIVETALASATVTKEDKENGITTVAQKQAEILRPFAKGMLIDLTTPEIRFANGNFQVDKDGNLTARGSGSIGGWEIGDNYLRGGNKTEGYTTLYSNNGKTGKAYYANGDDKGTAEYRTKAIRFNINDNFKVYEDGSISIGEDGSSRSNFSVDSSGNLYSQTGTVGGWVVKEDKLISPDQKTKLYANNKVKNTALFASGSTTTAKEKNIRIDVNDKFKIYSDGAISIGGGTDDNGVDKTVFSVDSNGKLFSKSGLIGGWVIKDDRLESTDGMVTLMDDGTMYGGSDNMMDAPWLIDSTGYARFTNIEINSENASRMQSDGSGALFEWGSVKFWNKKASHPYQKNAGEIGGWWFDANHFTSSRTGGGNVIEMIAKGDPCIKGNGWALYGNGTIELNGTALESLKNALGLDKIQTGG